MTANGTTEVAAQLWDWFNSILRLTDKTLFSMVPEGPHRDAIVLDVLLRNARTLVESKLDQQGNLYSPVCLLLAAACRKLGVSLTTGHWESAVDNVVRLRQQTAGALSETEAFGLEIGGPASLFKQQLEEALINAGLAGSAYLDRENRDIALGLATNWGMRFLLAYALECRDLAIGTDRKDLPWMAELLRTVHSQPSGARS